MPADRVADRVADLLGAAADAGVLSAAAWSWGSGDTVQGAGHLGAVARGGEPVAAGTLFDLASVTKPVVAIAVLRLAEQGRLALTDTVGDHLGWETPLGGASVEALLTHTSGAPGPTPLWREHRTRAGLLAAVRELPLSGVGAWTYSSMGFIVLGLVVEAVAGEPLDRAVRRLVTGPAGMAATTYRPGDAAACAATEDCAWRGRVVRGEVHDENCAVLSGIAGHAGLFAPVGDVAALARVLTTGRLLSPATSAAMAGRGTGRPLGWWPRGRSPWLGAWGGPAAYAHTGFTGTSLAIDPDDGRWCCLLTNRVHPSREPRGFDRVRRAFHDACADAT